MASLCPRSSDSRPGVSARRVDEGDERQPKTLGEAHQTKRLSIALGLGHAVVASHPLFGVAALLVPHDHHRPTAEPRESPHQGPIIREHPVAVQLFEFRERPR